MIDRRAFLTALMGALAAPALPIPAAVSGASEGLIPAGSAITVPLDLWERPYTILFFFPGKLTLERAFRVATICFQGDDNQLWGKVTVELIVNGRPLCSGPIHLAKVGLNPLFPFVMPVPILIPKGTEIECRCHGGGATMIVCGSQFFTQAEMEAMPEEPDEIDAEFIHPEQFTFDEPDDDPCFPEDLG